MASNSEVEAKKYSRPCFSCPRGERVVCDTEGYNHNESAAAQLYAEKMLKGKP